MKVVLFVSNIKIILFHFVYQIKNFIANWQNASNDDIYSSEYVESHFSITCCRDGRPGLEPSVVEHARDFEFTWAGAMMADRHENVTCNRFNGRYALPANITRLVDGVFTGGVRCLCSEKNMDRNCRQFADECQNGG